MAVDDQGDIVTSTNPTAGLSAWTSAAVGAPACVVARECLGEQVVAYDSAGTMTLDSVATGNGKQLANLALSGDQLTWTRDGMGESATLS